MTMLRITVSAENNTQVVVTWSPEYGASVLGNPEHVTVEEVPARDTVDVPLLDLPPLREAPRKSAKVLRHPTEPGPCLICGCPPHEPRECQHDCLQYVEG